MNAMICFQKIDSFNYLVKLAGGDSNYWLILLEPRSIADDEQILLNCIKSNETKEYASVLGANKTVKVLREIEAREPKIMTREEFIDRLKSGVSWTLKGFVEKSCNECFGDGKLSVMQNYARCGDCQGLGNITMDLLVKW